MLCKSEKTIKHNDLLDMIYIANDGVITQRRIHVIKVSNDVLQAYCYLRRSNRTFKISNILALTPVTVKKRMLV